MRAAGGVRTQPKNQEIIMKTKQIHVGGRANITEKQNNCNENRANSCRQSGGHNPKTTNCETKQVHIGCRANTTQEQKNMMKPRQIHVGCRANTTP